MPIRPENKGRYPENWGEIRQSILRRARNRCEGAPGIESCGGVENGSTIYRAPREKAGIRAVKIVLTIAHLDHQPENNDPSNLRALCQRCHNRYDLPMRLVNRKKRLA